MKDHLKTEPYVHYFPPAPEDPTFPGAYDFKLVDTEDALSDMAQSFMQRPLIERVLAVDTETTGFSIEKHTLVGKSLCFEPTRAYYVPVGHVVGRNLDKSLLTYILQMIKAAHLVLFFNAKFDLRFLRTVDPLGILRSLRYCDVAAQVWLMDSNVVYPDLKWAARHFLGWNMQKYEGAVAGNEDLSFNPPEKVLSYAGGDAVATFRLHHKLMPHFSEKNKFILNLDSKCCDPVGLMEDTPTPIDIAKVQTERQAAVEEARRTEQEVYQAFGRVFKLNSPQVIGQVLRDMGEDTGERTKTGRMATGKKVLEKVQGNIPAVKALVRHRECLKFVSSYCDPLLKEYRPDLGGVRFAYALTATPTGRLAAGSDKNNPYFAKMNVQAVDKAPAAMYDARLYDGPGNLKGWMFEANPDGKIEGFDPKQNIRTAFVPRPGHLWVHLDYKAQELRIPANLSLEPRLVVPLLKGLDLHMETAIAIWGPVLGPKMRKIAKALNFGALYGGSKYTFARQIDCSLEEAEEYLRLWWQGMRVLARWVKSSENLAKREGTVHTYFGRPRRVRAYLSSKSWKLVSFGKRTAVNTQVQGAGADIIKIAMCNVYNRILTRPEHHDRALLLSCIHDELNFSVENTEPYFTDTVKAIQQEMQFEVPGWQVPMLVDMAFGQSWGSIFSFRHDGQSWRPA